MKKTINLLIFLSLFIIYPIFPQKKKDENIPEYYKPYLKLLKDVYETMDREYYKPVSYLTYKRYVEKYKKSVLSKLKITDRRVDQIAYIGAGLLVENLKAPEDKFSGFMPPKKAEEYSEQVYGYRYGIGIKGQLTEKGFVIQKVEKRSDAYQKGIRENDIIVKINNKDIKSLSLKEINNLLYPPLGELVNLDVFKPRIKKIISYRVECKEYFIETIEEIPTHIKGLYCLKIKSFNRKTHEDLKDYIKNFSHKGIKLLILDLRDNPGGPPLSVYEISGIFLSPGKKLFYYQKKNKPVFGLTSPTSEVVYKGPLIILINEKSGSASELLAGTLQAYKRATIVGKQHSAGFAFLKSTFKFGDGSMLTLITGDTYLFNDKRISIEGVQPDIIVPKKYDSLNFVLKKYKENKLNIIYTDDKK